MNMFKVGSGGLDMWNRASTTERQRKGTWSGNAPGAEVIGGVQLICAALYSRFAMVAEEPYGRDYGGGMAILFSLFVMCVLGPAIVFIMGCVHTLLFTTPVMVASNAVGVRTRISAPWWTLPAVVLLAAGYAVPISLLIGTSYAATFGWIAAAGLLPVGVAVFARMREVPRIKVWRWALVPSVAAVLAAFYCGLNAPMYRPPVLERADYVGEWAGGGVRLELGAQGTVVAEELPVPGAHDLVNRCSGHGTWKAEGEDAARGLRSGVALTIPDCKSAELRWAVAGTDERPELFVLVGDPDDGDVSVLRKRTE
ncbi:hypothetical protein [Streptomyces vinaceus]|uniref:hypothetical protein n=1 Tax=Streptomyces vinaceus TaxID=1960 RepID=UPI0035DD9ACA